MFKLFRRCANNETVKDEFYTIIILVVLRPNLGKLNFSESRPIYSCVLKLSGLCMQAMLEVTLL